MNARDSSKAQAPSWVKSRRSRLKKHAKNKPLDVVLAGLSYCAASAAIGILLYLVVYIVRMGVPYLTPSLFAWNYTSKNVSMMPSLITTLQMTGLSLLISVPLGIGSAIYLVEYAKSGSRFVSLIRMMTETLAGIPSIVYALFGLLFFVTTLGLRLSLISGALTLAVMVLPLILRTTEEALISVPNTFREGAFGLGAGRLRTVFRVVLPSALPGLLAGIILAIGRIVGETAALIYTAGTMTQIPTSLSDSGRTLAVHMWALSNEGLHTKEAYATAFVLLLMVIVINTLAAFVARRLGKALSK